MRRMLGILRSEVDAPQPPDQLEPPPGPADLPELVDRVRMVGVRAHLDVRGVAELPQAVGLSVYRIVQEALTNVVKHAAPAQCWVTVDGSDREVLVEVTDDGHAAGPGRGRSPGGHGLIGMRERVNLYGGDFSFECLPGGGFRVTARLPYASEHRPAQELL
jgi:signal transduction histidine kinase